MDTGGFSTEGYLALRGTYATQVGDEVDYSLPEPLMV